MFCLQNHPKYAPIYLNLPSGNNPAPAKIRIGSMPPNGLCFPACKTACESHGSAGRRRAASVPRQIVIQPETRLPFVCVAYRLQAGFRAETGAAKRLPPSDDGTQSRRIRRPPAEIPAPRRFPDWERAPPAPPAPLVAGREPAFRRKPSPAAGVSVTPHAFYSRF